MRFVQIFHGSNGGAGAWDAHGGLKTNHSTLCEQVDQPIAALIARSQAARAARRDDGRHRHRVRPHARHAGERRARPSSVRLLGGDGRRRAQRGHRPRRDRRAGLSRHREPALRHRRPRHGAAPVGPRRPSAWKCPAASAWPSTSASRSARSSPNIRDLLTPTRVASEGAVRRTLARAAGAVRRPVCAAGWCQVGLAMAWLQKHPGMALRGARVMPGTTQGGGEWMPCRSQFRCRACWLRRKSSERTRPLALRFAVFDIFGPPNSISSVAKPVRSRRRPRRGSNCRICKRRKRSRCWPRLDFGPDIIVAPRLGGAQGRYSVRRSACKRSATPHAERSRTKDADCIAEPERPTSSSGVWSGGPLGAQSTRARVVVIDDGGHEANQQIATFEELLPHLRPGGVFLCEDIHGAFNRFASYMNGVIHDLNTCDSLAADPNANDRRLTCKATGFQSAIHSIHSYPFVTAVEKRAISAH